MPAVADVHDAEEIFEAILEGVRIALDIEEQVSRRRDRERGETALRLRTLAVLGKEELVLDGALYPPLELDASLLADALQGALRGSIEWRHKRQWERAELGQGRHAAIHQGAPLLATDPRHQAEMVVGAPSRLALDRPAAHVAMLDRFRIGARGRVGRWRRVRSQRLLEALLGGAVIRHEIVDTEDGSFRARCPRAPRAATRAGCPGGR